MTEPRPARPFLFAMFAGILGGGAMILTITLSRRGPMIFLPYGALIAVIAAYLHWRRIASFGDRFGAALLAFMVGTIILQTYTVTIVNPAALATPIWHKVWPLGVFLFIGSAVSAVVAKATPARASS